MMLWNPRTGKRIKVLKLNSLAWIEGRDARGMPVGCLNSDLAVLAVCFSPDGKALASGGTNNMVIVWDTKNWSSRILIPEGEPPQR